MRQHVAAAMEAEAAPLLDALELRRDDPPAIAAPAPCVSFSGSHFGLQLHIVCNGAALKEFLSVFCFPQCFSEWNIAWARPTEQTSILRLT